MGSQEEGKPGRGPGRGRWMPIPGPQPPQPPGGPLTPTPCGPPLAAGNHTHRAPPISLRRQGSSNRHNRHKARKLELSGSTVSTSNTRRPPLHPTPWLRTAVEPQMLPGRHDVPQPSSGRTTPCRAKHKRSGTQRSKSISSRSLCARRDTPGPRARHLFPSNPFCFCSG